MKKLLLVLLLLPVLALVFIRSCDVADFADETLNVVKPAGPPQADDASRALHDTLLVADMHADPLLWGRNLAERSTRGAVDIPRLIDGNVAVQFFGVVTNAPFTQNMRLNPDLFNVAALLAVGQPLVAAAWFSPLIRARLQAGALRRAAMEIDSKVRLVTTLKELEALLAEREAGNKVVGGVLALEGAYPLEGDVANLLELYSAGFRVLGLSHFVDSDVAGSAHGWGKGGLTDFGREVVARSESMGITLDLAHASRATIEQVLKIATRPLIVSHTGVAGTCPGPRNLDDEQLKAIAAKGGVVGIGLFPGAVCGHDVAATVGAMEYALKVMGPDHVGLGSDFDGAVTTPIDAAGLVEVTHALRVRGHADDVITRVMGGNVIRLLREQLK